MFIEHTNEHIEHIEHRIYVLDIQAHNGLRSTGIKIAVLSSEEEVNRRALPIRKFIGDKNSSKYIDRRSKDCVTHRIVKTQVSIVHQQLQFDEMQNDYLTQTTVFFNRR